MKCINLALDLFDPIEMKKNSTSIIIAKRERGKTVLAKDLVRGKNICHVFYQLESHANEYENFDIKTRLNLKSFPDQEINEKFPKDSVLLFDDCVKPISESEDLFALEDVFSVFTFQGPLCPLDIRKHLDYVFLGYTNNQQDIETMYWLYGRKIFPDCKTFKRVFQWCTADYTFMVIDNTSDSCKIPDRVFYYKAYI